MSDGDLLLAGRYRIGRRLGVGGMAEVVEAHDERLDRRVAIKRLALDEVDDVTRRRFLDEARSGARFSHPNAVAVYDAGIDQGWMYLVMEPVDGPTLAEVIAEQGRLPIDEAVRVTTRMLDALRSAHAVGLVHRDVKPGNVLFGLDGTVKLADFGIAKRLDAAAVDHTAVGQFVGTPRYLAPEQAAGEPATPSSDVYAAGVVLFEMLAGRPPFEGDHALAVALAHRDAPLPDLTELAPGTPPAVAAVVARAMAKAPADRFAGADEMAEALRVAVAADVPAATGAATMATGGPAPTQVAPIPGPLGSSRRGRDRRVALVGTLVVAAVLALVVRSCADGDDGVVAPGSTPSTTTAGVATVAPTASAPAPTSPPATPPPPTVPVTTAPPILPTTPAELLALLAPDPNAYGDAGPELVDRLTTLQDREGRKLRDDAGKLVESVTTWVDQGRLDPDFAALVLGVVEPLSQDPGPGNGPGGDDGDD